MLEGKTFFPAEIAEVLSVAYNEAATRYEDAIGSVDADTWRTAFYDIAAIKVEVNQLIDAGEVTSYNQGSSLWDRIDTSLTPFAAIYTVVTAIKNLPNADTTIPSPYWLKNALILAGIGGALVVGYYWVKK